MYNRKQIFEGLGNESAFLWGVRQSGKSTLLRRLYPEALYFDLLLSDVYERFMRNPSLLKEILQAGSWLIVNMNIQFILSGSSPRKIIRQGGNLLGGRALRYELYPLVSSEIPDFDLIKALNSGLLPRHYLSNNPGKLLSAYIGSYLRDEIVSEARIRNVPSFSRFLEAAAFSNGELVNYSNIAADCGVSAPTIKEYFQILEDTMVGRFLPSYQRKPKRRVISAPRFYYFDVGIAGYLLKRENIRAGSEVFGKAFEHFIFQELFAYSKYSGKDFTLSYWRTASQIEVDFILGENEAAIEVKSTGMVNPKHLKGLKAFNEEYTVRRSIVVSTDMYPRRIHGKFSLNNSGKGRLFEE